MTAIRSMLLAGVLVPLVLAGPLAAQDSSQPTLAQLGEAQGKVKLASGLIALGRADQDPLKLLVGARILADLGSPVADPASAEASTAYDVGAVLAEAKALAGSDRYLLDAIAAVPAVRTERGERYCGWGYVCGTFECGWVYSCGW